MATIALKQPGSTISRRTVVTGATGFVGRAVCVKLTADHRVFSAIARKPGQGLTDVGDIAGATDWRGALAGADAVIHLAARVHVMRDTATDPLTAFRKTNVDGALNLARQAAAVGVRRFVFVSSIKVNGEETEHGRRYRADDPPDPRDPYGISKREAEDGLRAIAAETGLEVVIIRPPLVYGAGVRANFAAMMRAVQRGVPLPFGSVTDNRRSLVAVDNLVDLILRCLDHPAAANQTFLVSDDDDLSTAGLLTHLGIAFGRPARLVRVPVSLLNVGASLAGKRDMARRLLGSLQVDITETKRRLDWTPPKSVDQALADVARAARNSS